MLSCRDMASWLSTHSPTVEVLHRTSKWGEVRRLACPLRRFPFAAPPNCGGSPAKRARGECISNARQGGCMVLAAKGGIKTGAEGAVPPQWNGTSYLPRAEPSTRPGGVSRSRTEPWQPRAKGPAAGSTLTPVRACQPSGILESTAQVPVPIPTAPKGA